MNAVIEADGVALSAETQTTILKSSGLKGRGEKMKNRFFVAISAILVTGALLLSATAQDNKRSNPGVTAPNNIYLPPGGKLPVATYLQCSVWGAVEFPHISITNNTSQTLPAGTKVFWQANSSLKGSIALTAPLAPGKSVDTGGIGGLATSAKPTAWFFK